jgi:hypothetical protein
MSQRVGRGGTIVLDAAFSDGTGQLVDPVAPTVEVIDPNGVQVVAPTSPTRNPSVGVYEYDFIPALDAPLGVWTARWSGTINGTLAVDDDFFEVVAAGTIGFTGAAASLASVEDLDDWLGGTAPSAGESARRAFAIRAASAIIRRWTHRTFTRVVDDQVRLRGNYGPILQLPQRPVAEVTAVRIDGYEVTDWTLLADGRLRLGENSHRHLYAVHDNWFGSWGGPDAKIEITYTHGYTVVPDDVTMVTVQAAARILANPSGVRSESVGTYSVSHFAAAGELTIGERALLAVYKPRVQT